MIMFILASMQKKKKNSGCKKKLIKMIIRCFNVHIYFEYCFKYAGLMVFSYLFFF